MAKKYITPEAEFIEINSRQIIALSISGKSNPGENNKIWANEYDSNEYAGSWDGIWDYMYFILV